MITKRILALVVGINRYHELRPLSSAVNDAQDIALEIRLGGIPSQVRLLTDGMATRKKILSALRWLATEATVEDTVLVFFSGHGCRASTAEEAAYFCSVEASFVNLDQTSLTSRELTEALRKLKSERLIVLLDTCHAGAIGEPRTCRVFTPASLAANDISSLVEGKGRVILGASRPDEVAWELSGMRNGLFTSFLLRALRGRVARADGTIWASDVFSFVSQNVRRFAYQHTYQKAIGEDFVVMVRQPQKREPTTFHPGAPFDQRALRNQMRAWCSRAELSLLCSDVGVGLEDLPGTTLETQIMALIDHCYRHGIYDRLMQFVQMSEPKHTSDLS